jgi:hypothetical protein
MALRDVMGELEWFKIAALRVLVAEVDLLFFRPTPPRA